MPTTLQYALMAGASYISTRPDVNKFPIPQDWYRVSYSPPVPSGFEAAAFGNGTDIARSTEIVISYAGTYDDGSSVFTNPDKQADAALGLGLWSDQLGQAAAYYLEIKALNPGATISFTGHSLGGGLASLMAVFFGETAYTFDQAPFKAALSQAQNLRTYLLTREAGIIDPVTLNNLLAPLDRYITAANPDNLNPIVADTLAGRQTGVLDINVNGEFLSTGAWALLGRIGTQTVIPNSTSGVSGDDLHSQALLSAFLQSDKSATTFTPDGKKQSLSQVTTKLTDLLGMIFDKKLFAYPTDKSDPNFLERLVKHEAGVRDPATGATTLSADAMVTRFTRDLWKLAQDGGLTMTDGVPGSLFSSPPNNVSKALIAFAMQMYYEDTANATNASKELFTAVSGGIQFDMADVSKTFALAFQNNQKLTLNDAKGYKEYFSKYINTPGFSPFDVAERSLIASILPYMRDWTIQAGTSPLNIADDKNRNAFMLGGSGTDALIGGTGTDLLVGNGGIDTLMGKEGNDYLLGGEGADSYVYRTGDGLDTIQDADGGKIYMDDVQLTGGAVYGDSRVHRSTDGKHLYVKAGSNLIVDGDIIIQGTTTGSNFEFVMDGAAADVNPVTTLDINGDLAPIDFDPATASVQTQTDDLGNIKTDSNTPEPDRADTLYDSAGNDHIRSYGGKDIIIATRGGNNLIEAGAGRDSVTGGSGKDVILGGADGDILNGGLGDDRIYADTQITTEQAIANGISQTGSGQKGDWLAGRAANDNNHDLERNAA